MADSNASHVLVLLGDLAQQQHASEASQFISLYRCYFKYVGVASQSPPNLTFQWEKQTIRRQMVTNHDFAASKIGFF